MRVVDRSVLKLIQQWLESPIVEEDREGGKKKPPSKPGRPGRGTPQGGVISPLLANVYLHWFDRFFHSQDGPLKWANARLVRYADDFVVMARYCGERLTGWIEETLEVRMDLEINRTKTSVVNLEKPQAALDFLGFRFTRRACQFREGRWYWHQQPSPKSLQKERDWLREETNSRRCYASIQDMIDRINEHRRGWGNYFRVGQPREMYRALNHFTRCRLTKHLKRRSQRGYKRPRGESWYTHLRKLGLADL